MGFLNTIKQYLQRLRMDICKNYQTKFLIHEMLTNPRYGITQKYQLQREKWNFNSGNKIFYKFLKIWRLVCWCIHSYTMIIHCTIYLFIAQIWLHHQLQSLLSIFDCCTDGETTDKKGNVSHSHITIFCYLAKQ